jgi:hypothetical protein
MLTNFDFAANWDRVLHMLQSDAMKPRITEAMRQIHTHLARTNNNLPEPSLTVTLPGQYSCFRATVSESRSSDEYGKSYWNNMMEAIWDKCINDNLKRDSMPQKWRTYRRRMKEIDDIGAYYGLIGEEANTSSDDDENSSTDDEHDDEPVQEPEDDYTYFERRCDEIEADMADELSSHQNLITQPIAYLPFGHESIWAPLVGLPLARLLMPDQNWQVQEMNGRSVVVSGSRICDISEWAISGNLAKYIYGDDRYYGYADCVKSIRGVIKFHNA